MRSSNRELAVLPHGWSRRLTGLVLAAAATASALPTAWASELSYTFLDVQRLEDVVDAGGVQIPIPSQTVNISTGGGDGVAVGGSIKIRDRFYVSGTYRSSVVDVTGVVTSPLATTTFTDDFDLTLGRLSFGYLYPIGNELDLIAEVSYDSVHWDFGSAAGEDFDASDTGVGAQAGVRWNPRPAVEVFGFARHLPMAKADLSARTLESGMAAYVGVRFYLFKDLGLGIEHEAGDVDTTMISMRFSFGNLPW